MTWDAFLLEALRLLALGAVGGGVAVAVVMWRRGSHQ